MGSGHTKGYNRIAVKGLADRLELDRDQLLTLQKQFAEIAKNQGNPHSINREEFEQVLKLVGIVENDQLILSKVFTMFDRGGDGNMTFMEFVVGISTFINGDITERLNFSFQLYDLENNGKVSRDEMSTVLRSMHSTSTFFGDASLSEEQIQQLVNQVFSEATLLEDGNLSYTEYMTQVAKNPVLVDFLARLQASEMSEDQAGVGEERRKSLTVAEAAAPAAAAAAAAAAESGTPLCAVVVGGNRGIGLEMVRLLIGRGYDTHATTRSPSDTLSAVNGVTVIEGVDLSQDSCSAELSKALGDKKIDLLVVNAGVLTVEKLPTIDCAAVLNQLNVNCVGPMRVLNALHGNLKEGSKVGLMSSRMGSIDDRGGGMYGYSASKAALNMFGKTLSNDLKPKGISVALLHPGMVRTDMTARFGDQPNMKTPEEAAALMVARLDGVTLENTGRFWSWDGSIIPW